MSRYSIDALQSQVKRDLDDKYWNNYQWLQSLTEYPLVGNWANRRMQSLAFEENSRYWSDYMKNTGTKGSRYPIRSGVYGHYASDIGEGFAVSDAIMSLYGRFRW